MSTHRFRPICCALLLLAFTGCQETSTISRGCKADDDCGDAALFRCDEETAECRCRSSAACPEGESCNLEGYCQAKVGCHQSSDCPTNFFCDVGTSTCLP
ncbi:MAG: hypothetical protein ACK4N5_06555, partial [Myxococcales bacterium]